MKHLTIAFAACILLGALDTNANAEDTCPNILFCIADDASYPHMGAYGCDWVKTPAFDRVADEGILFTRAYTPNAKCAPSRSCILTGRNSWQLEAAANHIPYFPAKFKTYTDILDAHGYFVGKTGKGWAPGVAKDAEGNQRLMAGKGFDAKKLTPPAKGISSNDYAANFEDFLNAKPEGRPFCFWYGATEPHRGYEYGSGVAKGGKSIDEVDEVPAFWPDNEVIRNDMLDYAFEIEHFDTHLGRMLTMLEERGELDNTLVVVTADNGMPFPRVKGQEYEMSNHLPLAVMWPKGVNNPGRKVDDYVSFIDFAPTFLDVAGIDCKRSGMHSTPGKSLTPIFQSGKSGIVDPSRDRVLIGKERHDIGRPNDWGYPIRGIVKSGMLYIRNFEPTRWPAGNPETGYLNCDGSPTKTEILNDRRAKGESAYWNQNFGKRPTEEMYNVAEDVYCMKNLIGDAEYAALRDKLEAQLVAELEEQGDPRALGQGNVLEQYPYANVGQQNFYGKYMGGQALKAGWVSPSDFEPEPLD